jgi:hypothetical protein
MYTSNDSKRQCCVLKLSDTQESDYAYKRPCQFPTTPLLPHYKMLLPDPGTAIYLCLWHGVFDAKPFAVESVDQPPVQLCMLSVSRQTTPLKYPLTVINDLICVVEVYAVI